MLRDADPISSSTSIGGSAPEGEGRLPECSRNEPQQGGRALADSNTLRKAAAHESTAEIEQDKTISRADQDTQLNVWNDLNVPKPRSKDCASQEQLETLRGLARKAVVALHVALAVTRGLVEPSSRLTQDEMHWK